MDGRLKRFWRRFRSEVAEAWADSNRASALLQERRQVWRTRAPLRWANSGTGPRLIGSVLPPPSP
jgi:hypothetical protein